jgi:hypothetical protein
MFPDSDVTTHKLLGTWHFGGFFRPFKISMSLKTQPSDEIFITAVILVFLFPVV